MVAMATWQDGPEYAPLTRPEGFGEPNTPPVSVAPPDELVAAIAPKERPAFTRPPEPVAPLASLAPPVEQKRDPALPFQVVSTTLTLADSAWGAAHWTRPPNQPAGSMSPQPAPSAGGGSSPTQPLVPVAGAPPTANGFPAPGTAEWFTPSQYSRPAPTNQINARQVLDTATPGVCICLAVGGLIYVISPVMLAVAYALSSRIPVAASQIRQTFVTALSLLGVFAVLGALTEVTSFGGWWNFVGVWSLIICWITLLVVVLLVYRDLKRQAEGGSSAPPSRWG